MEDAPGLLHRPGLGSPRLGRYFVCPSTEDLPFPVLLHTPYRLLREPPFPVSATVTMSIPANPPTGPQILESPHAALPGKVPRGLNLATFVQSNPSNVPSSKIAFVSALDPSHKLTRGEVFQSGHELAWSLRNVTKLQKRDRVAIFTSNNLWYPVLVHANLLAGLVSVTLNPAYTAEELAHPLADAQPKVIFTTRELMKTVRESAKVAGWKGEVFVVDGGEGQGSETHIKQLMAKSNGQSFKAEWIEEPEKEDAFIGEC